jgi:hypothetical protein
MAQQDTAAPAANNHPQGGNRIGRKQSRGDARTEHIFAICYVEQLRALKRLQTMRANVLRKNKFRETPTADALWKGCCAIEDETREMLKKARDIGGHLLLCWEGSSIVEFYDRQEVRA